MTIEERLEALERELENTKQHVRRLWVGLGLAVFLTCALVWGFTATTGAAKGIRANRFIVVDENGKTRAWMVADEGGSELVLADENHKRCAWLSIGEGGPVLTLFDENGKTRVALSAAEDGPKLKLFDDNGKVIWHAP